MGFGRAQAFITTRSYDMHTAQHIIRTARTAALAAAVMGLAACAGMTQQEKSTAIGAGVGAIGGSILTGGSTAGTLGGAAVGGVIGHEVNKK
jgi:osmotically inducible lipoprotein OsmB